MMDKSMIHARSALVASCLMLCMWVGLWWNCVTLYADPIIGEWGISRTQFMLVATIMALTNAVVQMFFTENSGKAWHPTLHYAGRYCLYLWHCVNCIIQELDRILFGSIFVRQYGWRDYQQPGYRNIEQLV